MKLSKLQLENFRNYKKHSYEFSKDKNIAIIVGENAVGKTNFLEAIYVLSLGRSFRSLLRDDLIKWDMDYMRCSATVLGHDEGCEATELEVFYTNYPNPKKNFKKNGVSLKNTKYLGNLLTVLFHPEDLNMLYLSPGLRRQYLDIALCQTDRNYLNALANYKKVLKQRNALLQEIREAKFKNKNFTDLLEDLDAWDKEMIEFGTEIIAKRQNFTDFLNKNLTKIYQSISGSKEKIKVTYATKINNYATELLSRRNYDILRGQSTIGPHRDDLIFHINDKAIVASASRGEFRSLLLAIKLAEIKFIQEKTGQNPVLLLDDVFSELDTKRQNHLLKAIQGCQTIITTTDASHIEKIASISEIIDFAR